MKSFSGKHRLSKIAIQKKRKKNDFYFICSINKEPGIPEYASGKY